MEIGSAEVKYKEFSNPDGPIYVLETDRIIKIVYENGKVEKFAENMKTELSLSSKTTMEGHLDWQMPDRLPIYRKFFLLSLLNKILILSLLLSQLLTR